MLVAAEVDYHNMVPFNKSFYSPFLIEVIDLKIFHSVTIFNGFITLVRFNSITCVY